MSSGTPWNVGEVGAQIANGAYGAGGGELSPRQAELDLLWRYYRCANYDGRGTDWNGERAGSPVERNQLAQGQYLPPGYYDAGDQTLPLKYRKPSAPYYLGKVIVDRFTGLLFSESRHPTLTVEGDEQTQDWINGFAEATRIWAQMIMARTYGGAMGAVGMGLIFRDGVPSIEIHDPRWSTPRFKDRFTQVVESFEKRYAYPEQLRDGDGEWVEVWFWYRRLITDKDDLVWPRVPVGDGEEPEWEMERYYETAHGLGFCPVVWIQNKPVQDDTDGDSDCHGTYELIESIDALIAQANRGVLANCDPTLVIASEGEMADVGKGSDNAIKLPAGGNAAYLEITGAGPKAAMELAEKLERKALTVARCVLDDTAAGQPKTATEIQRKYSGMLEQADIFREQYGELGVKRLLEMAIHAAKSMGSTRVERREGAPTSLVRDVIDLPPKVVNHPDGTVTFEERILGPSDRVQLKWPKYFEPSIDDVQKSVAAAGAAKQFGLVDEEHAVQFVAQFFQIEDVQAVMEKIKEVTSSAQKSLEGQVMGRVMSGNGGAPFKPKGS